MPRYFTDQNAMEDFLQGVGNEVCPFCGARGTLVRHGFLKTWLSPEEVVIRGRRIFCDPQSPHGVGCGRTQSLRTMEQLERRSFSTPALWAFLLGLLAGLSVRAAWLACGIKLCLRTAYRLVARLNACQSCLRTHLSLRVPMPPTGPPGPHFGTLPNGLPQVLTHLREAFGRGEPLSVFQVEEQIGVLAL